jgi:hypothetical protein
MGHGMAFEGTWEGISQHLHDKRRLTSYVARQHFERGGSPQQLYHLLDLVVFELQLPWGLDDSE